MYMLFIGSLVTGLVAGVMAGLFGVGGGILIVPALLFLFHIDGINPVFSMHLAVGTSLATIVFTNISATWNQHKRQSVHWYFVRHYTPGILLGAWLGARWAVRLDGGILRILFGLFEMAVGLNMLLTKSRDARDVGWRVPDKFTPLVGLVIGGISSMFGIGGGTLSVPALNLLSKLPMHHAVGSSSAIGVFLAIAGVFGFVQAGWHNNALPPEAWGFVMPSAFFGIAAGTLLTAPVGVRLAHALSAEVLRRSFGVFLLVVGTGLVFF